MPKDNKKKKAIKKVEEGEMSAIEDKKEKKK